MQRNHVPAYVIRIVSCNRVHFIVAMAVYCNFFCFGELFEFQALACLVDYLLWMVPNT